MNPPAVPKQSGYFTVPRAEWHERGAQSRTRSQPFTRREAWLDLVALAAWAPHARSATRSGAHAGAGRAAAELRRGEFSISVRALAARWTWSASAANRFLVSLVKSGEITQEIVRPAVARARNVSDPERVAERVSDRRLVVYRIANYDTYAGGRMPTTHQSETCSGTSAGGVRKENKSDAGQEKPSRAARAARSTHAPRRSVASISDQADLFGATDVRARSRQAKRATYVQRAAEIYAATRGAPSFKIIGAALKRVVSEVGDESLALQAFERWCQRGAGHPGSFPSQFRRYLAPQSYAYAADEIRDDANAAALLKLDRAAGAAGAGGGGR